MENVGKVATLPDMAYPEKMKKAALQLRAEGHTVNKIAASLRIAKSTVSVWVRDGKMPAYLEEIIKVRQAEGREKGRMIKAARFAHQIDQARTSANKAVEVAQSETPEFWRLVAALLYWCEGGKETGLGVRFTNSDPDLVRIFLKAMRFGFLLEEGRWRALLHLHTYHQESQEVAFWSECTGISEDRFYRSFRKVNTGIRKHDGYRGCISVRYGDASIARTLKFMYGAFVKNSGA